MLNDKDIVGLMAAYLYATMPSIATTDEAVEKAYEIHTKAAARVVQGDIPNVPA